MTNHAIEQRVSDALRGTGQDDLRLIRVDCRDEVLKLSGSVRSYTLKQLAQETIRPLAVGCVLQNDVCVVREQTPMLSKPGT